MTSISQPSSEPASTPIASSNASTISQTSSKPDRNLILKPLPAVPGTSSTSSRLKARYGVVSQPPKLARIPSPSLENRQHSPSNLTPGSADFLWQFLTYLLKAQALEHDVWYAIIKDILQQLSEECRLPAVVDEQVQDARNIKFLQKRLQDKLRKQSIMATTSKLEETRRNLGVKLLGMHLEIIRRNIHKSHEQNTLEDVVTDDTDLTAPAPQEGVRFKMSCVKEIGDRTGTHLVYRRLQGEELLRQHVSSVQQQDKTNVLGGTIVIKATTMKEAAKVQNVLEIAVFALCNLRLEIDIFESSGAASLSVLPAQPSPEPSKTRTRNAKPSFFSWLIWNSHSEPTAKKRKRKKRQKAPERPLPYLPVPKNRFERATVKLEKARISVSPTVKIPPPYILQRLLRKEETSGASPDGLPVDSQAGLQCLQGDNNSLDGVRNHQRITCVYQRVLRDAAVGEYAPAKQICDGPIWRTFSYYNSSKKEADFSVGAIIEEFINQSSEICSADNCDALMSQHTSSFLHGSHRIDISARSSKVTGGQDAINLDDLQLIYMWSSCAFCKESTPAVVMSPISYSYSFGKYIEILCYSKDFNRLQNHSQPLCSHVKIDQARVLRHFSRGGTVCTIQVSLIHVYELRVPQMQLLTSLSEIREESLIANIVNDADSDYGVESISLASESEDEAPQPPSDPSIRDRDRDIVNNTRLDILHFYTSVKRSIANFEEHLVRSESKEALHSRQESRDSQTSASSMKALGLLSDLKYALRSDEFELYDQLKASSPNDFNSIRKALLDRIRYTSKKLKTWRQKHVNDAMETDLALPEYANETFHVFPGSSVLIRENEPSSIIAFTLSSSAYSEELQRDYSRASTPANEFDRGLSSKHSKASLLTSSSHRTSSERAVSEQLDPDDIKDDQALRSMSTDECQLSIGRKHFPNEMSAMVAALGRRGPSGLGETLSKSFQLGRGWDKKRADDTSHKGEPTITSENAEIADAVQTIDTNLLELDHANDTIKVTSPSLKEAILAEKVDDPQANKTLKASDSAKIGLGIEASLDDSDTLKPSELSKIAERLRQLAAQDDEARKANTPIPVQGPSDPNATISSLSTTPSSPFTSIWNFGSMRFRSSSSNFGPDTGSPVMTPSHEKMPSVMSSEYSIETSPHIKSVAMHKRAKISCTVYFAQEFESLRQQCGIDKQFIESMARCEPWAPSGGKSRSSFFLSMDGRFVIKQMLSAWNLVEKDALLKFAPSYFEYMRAGTNKPTVLAKIFGFYTVKIKPFDSSASTLRMDLLVMEHLFHGQHVSRTFDLKGVPERQAPKADGTLWDGDWILNGYKYSCPVHAFSKRVTSAAIERDSDFLASANVMDYSLLVGVDDVRGELVVGIVDYIGAYTWYKKMESKGKTTLKPGKEVTVLPPLQYKERFCTAVQSYFADIPDKWLKSDQINDDKLPSVL